MTTVDYLISKGYSEEEIETIMQEIEYYNQLEYHLHDFTPCIVVEIAQAVAPEFEDIPF